MNRAEGTAVVTTKQCIGVDAKARTARHIAGYIRVDYMDDTHFLVILTEPVGLGEDCFKEIWIPDTNVAGIGWIDRKNANVKRT